MIKSAIIFSLLWLGLAIIACEQQNNMDAVSQLETTKVNLKKTEPAEFTFKTNAPADRVKWNVSPNRNVQIIPNGYVAKIYFGDAGRYTIIATDDIITSRTAVTVDTTTYIPGDTTTVTPPSPPVVYPPILPADTVIKVDTVGTHDRIVSLEGDEFTITPVIVDSLSGQGLGMRIDSKKHYPCSTTYLHYSGFWQESNTGPYKLSFYHAVQPGARFCNGPERTLLAAAHIYPIPHGKTRFEISLNGTTYAGSITREENTFTISWPYTDGVKFSKFVLTK
mgnify:CR=1 FL=1